MTRYLNLLVYMNEQYNQVEASCRSSPRRQVASWAHLMRCLINAAILSLAFWLALGWLMFLLI
jgi:hypothetical protein